MEDNIFDLVNNFDSFEEAFDDGTAANAEAEFEENESFEAQEMENFQEDETFDNTTFENIGEEDGFPEDDGSEFLGNEEDGGFSDDIDGEIMDEDDHAFWENDASNIEESDYSGQSLGATPWAKIGDGPFDDMDGDGIPNFMDHYNGPGAESPWAGQSVGATPWAKIGDGPFDDMDGDGIPNFMDHYNGPGAEPPSFLGTAAQLSELSTDYENISFTDIFSEFLPDFMPDPISSPQDGSTDWDRAVDNFFEMLDPTEHYHCQEAPNSCAVAVQTDILNDFGINVSEAEMRELGEEHGIFSEEGGTPLEDVGKLLELHGIEVERDDGFSLNDLLEAKANGEKVIIGLDANEIWNAPGCEDHPLETMSGGLIDIPTAGHAVEFKGVVEDFDGQNYVVIDDPGQPYGHNVRIPLDDFDDAWDDFGHFAVITHTH